jgi:ABC-type lipopolysaccharide export system ATPase subunit
LTGSHALSSIPRSGSVFLKISPQQKLRLVSQILSEDTDDSKVVSLMDELGVDFILIQKTKETSLARLDRVVELTKIFENPSFVIFKFAKTD